MVDDEPSIARFIALLLTDEGYRVAVAHNGQEALDSVVKERPALIVLDIRMPMMTGWQVLARLQADGMADIPVIAMSADYLVANDVHKQQVYAYIDKPFSPDQLLVLVEHSPHTASA
ncbi:MAG: hypothetical protein NVSMB42_18090 [Herpetosiphon sp.]